MKSNLRVVTVQLGLRDSEKTYSYWTDFDVQRWDIVVAPVNNSNAFKIARVMKVSGLSKQELDSAACLLYCKIDKKAHEAREATLMTVMEIKTELRAAKELHDEMFVYQSMAAQNPRIKELLDQYTALTTNTALLGDKD